MRISNVFDSQPVCHIIAANLSSGCIFPLKIVILFNTPAVNIFKYSYLYVALCISNVNNVDIPGHIQLFARIAYLNSSSQTKLSI